MKRQLLSGRQICKGARKIWSRLAETLFLIRLMQIAKGINKNNYE